MKDQAQQPNFTKQKEILKKAIQKTTRTPSPNLLKRSQEACGSRIGRAKSVVAGYVPEKHKSPKDNEINVKPGELLPENVREQILQTSNTFVIHFAIFNERNKLLKLVKKKMSKDVVDAILEADDDMNDDDML